MTIEDLKNKRRFSAEEKQFLENEAVKFGINFEKRKNCQNCYCDLILQIYNAMKKANPIILATKYQLKDGVDVRIAATGERINNSTLTDEMAERFIKSGLKKYFVGY